MSTEEEECLENYAKGVETLAVYKQITGIFKKNNEKLPEVIELILIEAMDDIDCGLKYARPEMESGVKDVLDFLKSDDYVLSDNIIKATERMHCSLSLKIGYEDYAKECKDLMSIMCNKRGKRLKSILKGK